MIVNYSHWQANSNLKNYKKKLLPRFSEWMDVLGENSANGNIQKTCFTADVDVYDDDVSPQEAFDSLLGKNRSFETETINLDDDNMTQQTPASSTVSQTAKPFKLPQRKRKTMAAGLKEEMGNMRGTMENFVDVMKEKNHYEDIIWDQISSAIFSIEDMDEDKKVTALELFSGERVDNLKRCFLRIPEHKRKEWILKRLGDSSEE